MIRLQRVSLTLLVTFATAATCAACAGGSGGQPGPGVTAAFGDVGSTPGVLELALEEGTVDPASQTLGLSNAGTCDLAWSAAWVTVDGAGWLDVTPASGSLAAGASDSLSVSVDATPAGEGALRPGTYTGTITLTGTCALTGDPAVNSPISVAVNFVVTPTKAAISTDEDRLVFGVAPLADTWTPISMAGAPAARERHSAVWTGSRMIVWGGLAGFGIANAVATGGLYEPFTDTWTAVAAAGAPTPRFDHVALWTGSEMVVWGGFGPSGFVASGGRFDPATGTWATVNLTGAPVGLQFVNAVWTGSEAIVWGGYSAADEDVATGSRYNPATDKWTPMATGGDAPSARSAAATVWTGSEMIVWGGNFGGVTDLDDGARYYPATDTWAAMSSDGAPSPRAGAVAVWTGKEMLVYGGSDENGWIQDGGRYDPLTDHWTTMATSGAPYVQDAKGVWTGDRLLFWRDTTILEAVGVYDPAADAWSTATTTGQPAMGAGGTAVWTGSGMIVWGGSTGAPPALTSEGGLYQ